MLALPTSPYCPDRFAAQRRLTREVPLGTGPRGPIVVGGTNPVCVQSMTTTSTRDVEATSDQVCRLVESGCEIVRITAPTVKDALCIGDIRETLNRRGISVSLVADIHFQPAAAMAAADFVDKVRINPGNFADKKIFDLREYSDQEYADELVRIEERFVPLVEKCRRLNCAMRIGTNHGSLSDRIMGHFGDTPAGMVESAIEFVQICERHEYRDLILSMKASNPQVMIEANRLLVARMADLGMQYPIHLGVTEAGDGEDGRIKSAVGIGSLLEDGIGDTIRVSLTEDPECEIPVALQLVTLAASNRVPDTEAAADVVGWELDPYTFDRLPASETACGPVVLGGSQVPLVQVRVSFEEWERVGDVLCREQVTGQGEPLPPADIIALEVRDTHDVERLQKIRESWSDDVALAAVLLSPVENVVELCAACDKVDVMDGADWDLNAMQDVMAASRDHACMLQWTLRGGHARSGWTARSYVRLGEVLRVAKECGHPSIGVGLCAPGLISAGRALAARFRRDGHNIPVQLISDIEGTDDVRLSAAVQLGTLLCDGVGDSVQVSLPLDDPTARQRIAFNILQASGRRVIKTEYVACPSCGRTLFDLQDTTERIRSRTAHLKGVKIAIMGCIVNGPGEMADADFGYVGSSAGNVSLYVGKECVERNIAEGEADQRLVQLIRDHGRWVDP